MGTEVYDEITRNNLVIHELLEKIEQINFDIVVAEIIKVDKPIFIPATLTNSLGLSSVEHVIAVLEKNKLSHVTVYKRIKNAVVALGFLVSRDKDLLKEAAQLYSSALQEAQGASFH